MRQTNVNRENRKTGKITRNTDSHMNIETDRNQTQTEKTDIKIDRERQT